MVEGTSDLSGASLRALVEKEKSSEEVEGRERAGKTEKSQRRAEGTVWTSLQAPEETANLAGREAWLRSSVAHGWV